MPATEAGAEERELGSYELAFHVLPTVAEGEVTTVFQSLKDIITKHKGELTTEESPARFDLAYEIIKFLEGRNRKFSSAYFGWIRFKLDPSEIEEINSEVEAKNELLRHLLIRLTKLEEEHPFYFHEALEKEDKVQSIEIEEKTEVESKKNDSKEDVTEEDGEKVEDEKGAEEKEVTKKEEDKA